jgi:hypothetical protein
MFVLSDQTRSPTGCSVEGVAIVVLFVVLFTGVVGIILLAGAVENGRSDEPAPSPAPVKEPSAATAAARALAAIGTPAPEPPTRKRGKPDPFAPPSLVRSRSEAIPWGRTLLEFTHPAVAIVGIGMWIGFAFIKNKDLGVIAGAVLLAAAVAGVTWYLVGRRGNPLPVNRRVLAAHAGGALVALVLALVTLAHLTLNDEPHLPLAARPTVRHAPRAPRRRRLADTRRAAGRRWTWRRYTPFAQYLACLCNLSVQANLSFCPPLRCFDAHARGHLDC